MGSGLVCVKHKAQSVPYEPFGSFTSSHVHRIFSQGNVRNSAVASNANMEGS